MARVVIIENDSRTLKEIKESLGSAENLSLQKHELLTFENSAKALEFLNTKPCDLILLELDLTTGEFANWLKAYRLQFKVPENKTVPIVVLNHKEDLDNVKKCIKAGAVDYIVKPVDGPILQQKIELLLSKTGSVGEKQVYSLAVSSPVNVADTCTIEEVSEFGIVLKSPRQFQIGEVLSLYSEIFEVGGKTEMLGRVYKSGKHAQPAEGFQMAFTFLGVNPTVLKKIRTWMRQQYVQKKAKNA